MGEDNMDEAKKRLKEKRGAGGSAATDVPEMKSVLDWEPSFGVPRPKMNIHQKLAWVQNHIKVTKERGKGHDKGAGVSYEFRNAEDILMQSKVLCKIVDAHAEVDVTVQMLGVGAPVDVKCVGKDKYDNEQFAMVSGPRLVFFADAIFTDCETGEEIHRHSAAEKDWWRKGQTEPEKLSGSTDSYASKYALQHLFALDNNRDADMLSNERAGEEPAAEPW